MSLQEIKARLFERATSRTSDSSCLDKKSARHSAQCKLAKPVVHEGIYVYASDKTNGGIALAEKWKLTLVQPSESSRSKTKTTPRKSIITGVDTSSGLAENPEPSSYSNDFKCMVEEEKEGDQVLPCTLIMEDDYF